MSLITRCTACGTLFKVVADQLKVSQGWVRCGQCSEVFDAQANIVTEPAPTGTPSLSETAVTLTHLAGSPPSVSPHSVAPPSFTPGELPSEFPASLGSEVGPTSVNWSPSEINAALEADSRSPHVPASPAPASTWATPSVAAELSPSGADAMQSLSTLPASSISTTPEAHELPVATPGFVREAQSAKRWRSPWVRVGLTMLALLLLAILTLQYAYHERDELAVREPALKPVLAQLCEQLRCTIAPPQHIEAIVVDSSSFNAIPSASSSASASGQYYKLGVNLKNASSMVVALPHVELSLRDGQDQILLSRVLSPADLGAQVPALQPSAEMSGSVTVQVDAKQLQGQRISGYRVYAFYP